MVVEHEFVTAFEEVDAFDAVEAALRTGYFAVAERHPGRLVMRRGMKKPHARNVADLPQTVRLDFDRGRIEIAAAVVTVGEGQRVHERVGLQLVETVESLLLGDVDMDEAAGQIQRMDLALTHSAVNTGRGKPTKRTNPWVLAALVLLIVAMVVWIAYLTQIY